MSLTDSNLDRLEKSKTGTSLPALPFDLRSHARSIAMYWTLMFITSGLLPIVGFFALRYTQSVGLKTNWSIWLGITGGLTLYSLILRTWRLAKKGSTCRPLGATSGWTQDFFNWNFIFGTIILAAMISVGTSIIDWPCVSLPIAIVLLYVGIELVLVQILMAMKVRAPFRLSSVEKGSQIRSGCYILIEDIVAVDGSGGETYRRALYNRYEASPALRKLLNQMDWMWGLGSLTNAGIIFGLVFGLNRGQLNEVGYAVGWGLPWVWAGVMCWISFYMTRRMLRTEADVAGLRQPVQAQVLVNCTMTGF